LTADALHIELDFPIYHDFVTLQGLLEYLRKIKVDSIESVDSMTVKFKLIELYSLVETRYFINKEFRRLSYLGDLTEEVVWSAYSKVFMRIAETQETHWHTLDDRCKDLLIKYMFRAQQAMSIPSPRAAAPQ
jgi:hypothetical protein